MERAEISSRNLKHLQKRASCDKVYMYKDRAQNGSKREFIMKAVVSVIGKDRTGIIAAVSAKLAEWNINIEDISQTIMQSNFVMIMLVDASASSVAFDKIGGQLQAAVDKLGVTVHVQHEDLFNAMQRV